MSEFVWTEVLRIGVSPMDRDHQKIIEYMNELAKASERNAPFTELNSIFVKLNNFTRRHFQDEERFMESIGFEKLKTHKLIHKNLLDELDVLHREFTATHELGDRVFRFLAFWLKSHICGIDKQYAKVAAAV